MNAVDTNVVVYAFDTDEPIKQSKALDLLQRLGTQPTSCILVWQVMAEFLDQLRKWENKRKVTYSQVESAFQRVLALFPLQMPSSSVFQISFDLRSRFSLSHWDALLLAACKDAGVTTLYSEDMDDSTDYDGLKIVNPFA